MQTFRSPRWRIDVASTAELSTRAPDIQSIVVDGGRSDA